MAMVLRSDEGKALELPMNIPYVEIRTTDDKLAYLFMLNADGSIAAFTPTAPEFAAYAERFQLEVGKLVDVSSK